ncbi:MAG TPA: co-chaperone GroES [Ktedonobacterales bacterium]|nr:co-chaperone GroES [Ktedonobacterales bacterium]
MKTIQPFGDRVLVRAVEPRQQTASGIYLPDTSREGPGEGEIVAIGEGSALQEKLSVGDQILYQKFGGTEIKLEGATYMLLGEADILGRVVELGQLPTAGNADKTAAVA